jgi:hypothetical protein
MRRLTAFLLCALALACSDPQSATTETTIAPSYSGAEIIKFLDPFTLFPDFDAGRVFSVGIVNPIEDICTGAEPVFDGRVRQHFIVTPSGNVPELVASSGQATLVIYGAAPADPCDLSSDDILFRGRGRISVTSSDVDFTAGGATSTGYRVTGMGTMPDGQRVRAHVVVRVVFKPTGDVKVTVDKFELTPLGK